MMHENVAYVVTKAMYSLFAFEGLLTVIKVQRGL